MKTLGLILFVALAWATFFGLSQLNTELQWRTRLTYERNLESLASVLN